MDRPRRIAARGACACLAAAWLTLAAPAASAIGGELAWRAARAPAVGQALAPSDAAVRPAADMAPRSVVVGRSGAATSQNGQFDPFEDGAAEPAVDPFEIDSAEAEVPMPEAAPPAAPAPFDPFDEPAVEEPAGAENADSGVDSAPGDAPSDEPAAALDEIVAPEGATDLEELRESSDEAAAEIAAPAADDVATIPADELRQEVVVEEPATDDLLEDRGILDEDLDLELQVGPDGMPLPMTPEQLELRRQAIEKERQEHLAECEELYAAVRNDTIKNISLDIRLQGEPGEDFPFECLGTNPAFQPRNWAQTTYLWKASGMCHKPLYFEQEQLERYGHDWGPVLQPLVSGAHFFATIPILPYKMGIETPQECIYTLGHYRPGSCAPYMIEAFPFTWRAAAFQGIAVTGVAAAVP